MAEKRLIDADKIVNGISLYMTENAYLNDTPLDALKMVANWITDAQTVDAVEVVRCRDCAKLGLFTCPICFIENKTLQFVNISPDFFCGEGEQKDGAGNG